MALTAAMNPKNMISNVIRGLIVLGTSDLLIIKPQICFAICGCGSLLC